MSDTIASSVDQGLRNLLSQHEQKLAGDPVVQAAKPVIDEILAEVLEATTTVGLPNFGFYRHPCGVEFMFGNEIKVSVRFDATGCDVTQSGGVANMGVGPKVKGDPRGYLRTTLSTALKRAVEETLKQTRW